jgi:hypothetical protein
MYPIFSALPVYNLNEVCFVLFCIKCLLKGSISFSLCQMQIILKFMQIEPPYVQKIKSNLNDLNLLAHGLADHVLGLVPVVRLEPGCKNRFIFSDVQENARKCISM